METEKTNSKGMLWAGRIITALCVLFLIVDGGMKAVKAIPSMEGSIQLGWPENLVQGAGLVLLGCTALYLIPRTAILGAILSDRLSRGCYCYYGTNGYTILISNCLWSLCLGRNFFKK